MACIRACPQGRIRVQLSYPAQLWTVFPPEGVSNMDVLNYAPKPDASNLLALFGLGPILTLILSSCVRSFPVFSIDSPIDLKPGLMVTAFGEVRIRWI